MRRAPVRMSQPDRSQQPQDNSRLGILLLVVGVSIFSLQDVIIKSISGRLPVHQIVFVRSLLAAGFILVIVRLEGQFARLHSRRPGRHLLRAGLFFLTYLTYYMGLAALPLADAVTLFYAAPLFVTALSVPVLGERVGWRPWLAVLLGFVGVVVAMRPGAAVVDPAALLLVASAVLYALVSMLTRRLGVTESGSSMAFYSTLFMAAGGGLLGLAFGRGQLAGVSHASLLFLFRPWVVPTWSELGLLLLCGIIASVGYYCLSQAYRVAPASTVAPFEYTAVPLGVLWGFVFWGQLPGPQVVLGMVLILGPGIYVIRRSRRLPSA